MVLDSPKQKCRPDKQTRLHKYMAACGLGSRRACEALIAAGRVSVDGAIVRAQGVCIDPASQVVCLDRRPVAPQAKIFIALNKPRGFLCTACDPQGRRTFLSLLPPMPARVFTIGRLDCDSDGLLLATNDGDLAHTLMHPRYGVEKIYRVWTAQALRPEQEQRLRMGVTSQGERLYLAGILRVAGKPGTNVYQVRLRAGRNRHIRRMFEALGITILRLQRVAVGPLTLNRLVVGRPAMRSVALSTGAWRYLRAEEIQALRDVTSVLHSC